MYVIHKIRLQNGLGHYDLPFGSELLHVAFQHGLPTLWYKRPAIAPAMENRVLLLTATGHEFDTAPAGANWHFVGTMLAADQDVVFHVLELALEKGPPAVEHLIGGAR